MTDGYASAAAAGDTRPMPRSAPVRTMGERAVLVETDGTAATLALLGALQAEPMEHQVELVPGARSLLVRFSEPVDPADSARRIAAIRPAGATGPDGDRVTIDVVYDGTDLDEVGDLTGLGPDGVVTAHTATPWRVAFCGFSPGFGYLTGGDPRLTVHRRASPRPRVPAGSVGLADGYAGVYPGASPGGWQLIGRTGAVLWDIRRDPPALLRPGMTVRFRAVREVVTGSAPALLPVVTGSAPALSPAVTDASAEAPPRAAAEAAHADRDRQEVSPAGATTGTHPAAVHGARMLLVRRPGMQCTVQDLGRAGLADMGVSPSGAADRDAAIRANRIVGNDVGAAVLEILLGGAEFEAAEALLVALTGAPMPIEIHGGVSDRAAERTPVMDHPIAVPTGARIRLGRPIRGLRSYLAVRGGIAVPRVLGSRSSDLLAGIGPAPLRPGDILPVGDEYRGAPHPVPGADIPDVLELVLLPGPQLDWFAPGVLDRMCGARWTVSPASNRVGARLTGPDPGRSVTAELSSQGLVRGAVQVPPSGELVVFLADHPVTGGYPVVAVLTEASADLAAQARPGAVVRLRRAPSA